jgi:mRNA-degrading endonuclease RelE of RelBE toxin-antitoxin system
LDTVIVAPLRFLRGDAVTNRDQTIKKKQVAEITDKYKQRVSHYHVIVTVKSHTPISNIINRAHKTMVKF